jgi:hypothetical protein
MVTKAERIAENLARVRERIAGAARAAGRAPPDVRLVAVTKGVGLAEVEALVAAGCRDLGESRPQALWEKAAAAHLDVSWHLVGHLQRNKVARTVPRVRLIHSVDSQRLAAAIHAQASQQGRRAAVLIEVNVSGDAAKHGVEPEGAAALVATVGSMTGIELLGLMTVASLTGGPDRARRDFARLRELRDELRRDAPGGAALVELSMGMSGDFEQAIAEGATIVRIGSALFQGI